MNRMSEKAKDRLMTEAREKAKHLAPETISVRDDDEYLYEIAELYNAHMAAAKDLLTRLLMECLKPDGPKRVEFDNGGDAWSNIQGRTDIAVHNFVDKHISYITKIE